VIVWAVKYFYPYLYGTTFTIIVTNHRPLVRNFNINDPGSRLMRWRLKLEECYYKIIHKAGKSNINVDALRWNPIRNDERVHNIQSQERKDNNKEDYLKGIYRGRETVNTIWISWCIRRETSRNITNNKENKIATWLAWHHDVENYISKCEFCQKNKLSQKMKILSY